MAVSISFAITQNSQNVANNTSNVTVKVKYAWDAGSHNTDPTTKYVTIDDVRYNFNDADINPNATTSGSGILFEKTLDIEHDPDGTKTIEVYAYVNTDISSGVLTKSITRTLTTIPRKSTLKVSNGKLGTAQTLEIVSKSSDFLHTITYKCGSASSTVCTKTDETSISWIPPWSLAAQNAGGTSVQVTLTITTYANGVNIGSNTYTISCSIASNSLSASNGTLGIAQALSVTRQSTSLVHTITYKCGSASGTICVRSTDAEISWTPPWDLALEAASSATSVSVTLTITTSVRVGDTYYKVGVDKTKTITCAINSASMTVTTGTLGEEQTFTVKRAGSFYHNIYARIGDETFYVATRTANTTIKWIPPISLASHSPSGTTVTIEYEIRTFSTNETGTGKNIGASRYVSKSYKIPSSVKPSVTLTLSDAEGYLAKYGKYVKGKSKLEFEIADSGIYGSSIVSRETTFNTKKYTTQNGTIEALPVGDNLTVIVTVKDSRGRTNTASKTISVYDYNSPKVTDLTVRRSNSDATSNPTGAYLAIDFSATVTALGNKNSAVYTLKYKKVGTSTYTVKTLTSLEDVYTVIDESTVISADVNSSYDIVLEVKDDFVAIPKNGVGASIKRTWSMYPKGLGFAFGKIAELLETFEVGWKARFYKEAQFDATATFKGDAVVEGILQNPLVADTTGVINGTRIKDASSVCWHDYGRKRVDFKLHAVANQAFPVGYYLAIFSVDKSHKANGLYALSAVCTKSMGAIIENGSIQIRAYERLEIGDEFYITGFWYTD